jgi:hypothetical protein
VRSRAAVKRHGRLPRCLLSGLLACAECGGTIRVVNGRELGCATLRGRWQRCVQQQRIDVAERKLIGELVEKMLSPKGVAFLERQVREYVREGPKARPESVTPKTADVTKKAAEIDQLRTLIKAEILFQAVAQAAIEKAEEELQALARAAPAREEKHEGSNHPAIAPSC